MKANREGIFKATVRRFYRDQVGARNNGPYFIYGHNFFAVGIKRILIIMVPIAFSIMFKVAGIFFVGRANVFSGPPFR